MNVHCCMLYDNRKLYVQTENRLHSFAKCNKYLLTAHATDFALFRCTRNWIHFGVACVCSVWKINPHDYATMPDMLFAFRTSNQTHNIHALTASYLTFDLIYKFVVNLHVFLIKSLSMGLSQNEIGALAHWRWNEKQFLEHRSNVFVNCRKRNMSKHKNQFTFGFYMFSCLAARQYNTRRTVSDLRLNRCLHCLATRTKVTELAN